MKRPFITIGAFIAMLTATNSFAAETTQNTDSGQSSIATSSARSDMSDENHFMILKEIIVDVLNCNPNLVTMEAYLTYDLGADSIDVYEIFMACKEEFGWEFTEEDFAIVLTVGDLYDKIMGLDI